MPSGHRCRVVSFNLWHGLSPASPLAFEALEPEARRKIREDLQVEVLRSLNPDFCFLQELNPVQSRIEVLKRTLECEAKFQPDLVGLKVLGLGFPLNLNSGLGILASQKHGLKNVAAVSLSRPGFNWVRSWASWQLQEERFALFCETIVPGWGKVLLVNTHFHHGLEATPQLLDKIDQLAKEHELNDTFLLELKERIYKANARRMSEMTLLLRTLKLHERRYAGVILCGDFNAEPESEIFHPLRELGFRDAWAEVHGDGEPGYTFDEEGNQANHLLQAGFPLTLLLEDLTFSAKTKEQLLQIAREHERRRRRIDYVWFRAHSQNVKVTAAQLVGKPNAEGLAPSDHFGLCIDF